MLEANSHARHGFVAPLDSQIPRPQTPTRERIKTTWYGLPSPDTPSCHIKADMHQSAENVHGSRRHTRDESTQRHSIDQEPTLGTEQYKEGRANTTGELSHDNAQEISLFAIPAAFRVPAQPHLVQNCEGKRRELAKLKEVHADLGLEHELLPSLSSARRSTRVQNKKTAYGKFTLDYLGIY